MDLDKAAGAVVRVGDGRGFVIAGEHDRLIVTAAHRLPSLPPCMSFSCLDERTYQSLLGPLGEKPTVSAECLFCDPIGDIALLGSPDPQERYEEAGKYEAMVNGVTPFWISAGRAKGRASLLSLDARWFQCRTESFQGGPWWLAEGAEPIRGGMSGSPIVALDRSAIGSSVLASAVKMARI